MKNLPKNIQTQLDTFPNSTKIFKDIGLVDKKSKLEINKKQLLSNLKKELSHYMNVYFKEVVNENYEMSAFYTTKNYFTISHNNKKLKITKTNFNKNLNFNITKKNNLSTNKYIKTILDFNKKKKEIAWINEGVKTAQQLLKSNLKIVFSTDPYDLATISMRGIKSCMRWDNQHSTHLVGTVMCPFTGLLYITNGTKTEYGEKMLYRALIRLVLTNNDYDIYRGRSNMKASLAIEPIYYNKSYPHNRPNNSNDYYNDYYYDNKRHFTQNHMIAHIFQNYLEKHCDLDVDIISTDSEEFKGGIQLLSKYTSKLDYSQLSLSDANISQGQHPSNYSFNNIPKKLNSLFDKYL